MARVLKGAWVEMLKERDYCQYLRKPSDAPGWCTEGDCPCPMEIYDDGWYIMEEEVGDE